MDSTPPPSTTTPRRSLDIQHPGTSPSASPSTTATTRSNASTTFSSSSTTANTSTSHLFSRNPSIRVKKEKEDRKKRNSDKVALKRSRSPIKLIKNIRSYLHVHKHKQSGALAELQPIPLNSLVPPPPQGYGQHYRSSSVPSSSILSSASEIRAPRERQASAEYMLDPEKQVLMLRVMSYFEHAGHRADEETAEYLLSSYHWDIDQTLEYSQALVEAVQGTLVEVCQDIPLQGAVNDQMTSCYIDALLFAMFARLSAFEGLLNVNLDMESDSDSSDGNASNEAAVSRKQEGREEALLRTHRLQTWLRMFVNQLRSGRLVHAHLVKELRQHLYSCGWHCPAANDPPGTSRQEDSSELFMFLTEKLHLPYLPLEQRLLHGAKISADDDKVITERMLQISIPTPEPTQPAKESVFAKFLSPKSNDTGKGAGGESLQDILSLEKLLAQHFYDNTLTGIRRKVSSGTGVPLSPGVEIPVSAWQVLELLPFYSSSNEQGGIIHASQSQYPADVVILPLILKRYSIGPDMQAKRICTPIDIPRRIDFSRFVNSQTSTPLQPPVVVNGRNIAPARPPNATDIAVVTEPASTSTQGGTLTSNIETPPGGPAPSQNGSPIQINTSQPPSRKYSMSLLQAADLPMNPGTPPPQYSPSHAKQFQGAGDDNKVWPNPSRDMFGYGFMDCQEPKVKYTLELKSVVCHVGHRLDRGHYRSYVADSLSKGPVQHHHPLSVQEPNWLKHDDLDPSGKRVHSIIHDSADMMDMETDWARNGYILFYELQTVQTTQK